jgi:quinol monooxygenase YgiN
MTAFNAVRFKVKPGQEQAFLDAHRKEVVFGGMREAHMIKTGERSYCLIAKWDSMEKLAAARPQMIATLDTFRNCLEDLGDGRGVTDAVSGEVVLDLK